MAPKSGPVAPRAATLEKPPRLLPGRYPGQAPACCGPSGHAITSGRQLFYDGDANSAWSRRFHDLVISHINDVSAGHGANVLSEAQLSLCRRAAAIECELERLDAMLSRSEAVNLDAYGRAASHLRQLIETLGLERRLKDVTPDPLTYAREHDEAVP